ncbi:RNA-directed DNA polymerase [Gossypium australe]|uniref:RNA-directed DNA polymerase n=1 Tax=Gossypium australe TaxID=47621 RepID=A0A5B6WQV5_9ROSI|nr:RNA-directed DNA polymerase [Gossypium australe]
MEEDCINYAKKCHKCQIYGDKIHVPPSHLHVMTSSWSFSMSGMDVIRPISPKASNGHRFIFVVVDYFTKWVEAALYTNVTKPAVSKFLKKEIICQYGMPERIISDNALNLNNNTLSEVCIQVKIKHHNSSPYRPKMNGAVEEANNNIKKITYKDWHEKLPFALYAYHTSVRTSTGGTPFSLVYGMDALNLIKEKRLKAIHHGDLVLKKILPIQKDFRGKWMTNWEGPYVVKKVFSGGALILTEMDGKTLPKPVNSDSVKKYFT